jgi:hypothetical protein
MQDAEDPVGHSMLLMILHPASKWRIRIFSFLIHLICGYAWII